MTRSRRPAAAGADPRPIVTYSHVPTDVTADERVEPRALDPDAAIIDAVEVPLVAAAEPVQRARQAPDLRADVRDDAFDSFEDGPIAAALEPERKRRRGGGLLALVVLIAFAGGAGAIAASLGVFAPPKPAAPIAVSDPAAELIALHKQIDALGEATTPEAQAELVRLTKRLAELEQSGAVTPGAEPAAADAAPSGDIGPAVRQISLTPQNNEDAVGTPAAAPPSPRPRPEKATPSVADIPGQPDDELPVAEPILPRPLRAAPKAAGLPPPAGKATDDNFIASVEKALADSQANRTEGATPPVAPMGAVPPVAGAVQPLPPPPAAALPQQPGDGAPIVLAPAAAGGVAPLPHLDADAADPFAPPGPPPPLTTADPRREELPPGIKLPPADIPNVPPADRQY